MGKLKVTNLKTGEVLFDSEVEPREGFYQPTTKDGQMNALPATREFQPKEIELIKSTIAKGATTDELKLFLYRCQNLGLDPLKPGQIYFIKYGSSPGTIVVGLEGFRSKAARTGKHTGTQRGVLRNEAGKCVGAWCEVSRADWSRPAREEVSLHEYNTGKGNWQKMPETMIKKVAEAAALRMAFPDDLGGIYVNEEMDQAQPATNNYDAPAASAAASPAIDDNSDPGEHVVSFGKKYKGMKIKDINADDLGSFIEWCEDQANKKGMPLSADAVALKVNFARYLDKMADGESVDGQEPPTFDDFEQLPF